MNDTPVFIPKELSWLSFNERVLQEANSPSTPLIERIRFLGIFSNNLDEFFRVRVADVRRLAAFSSGGKKEAANQLLVEIIKRVMALQNKFNSILKEIIKELVKQNIHLIDETELSLEQQEFASDYFRKNIIDALNLVLLDEKMPLPEFRDYATYFAIKLHQDGGQHKYAVVEIPSTCPRFVVLPKRSTGDKAGAAKHNYLIFVDNIIRHALPEFFDGIISFNKIEAHQFKVTRDAELELDEGISQSLLDKISNSLKKRAHADPVRLVHDESMPEDLRDYFVKKLRLNSYDSIIAGGRYHNLKDLMSFPNIGLKSLEFKPHKQVPNTHFDAHRNPFHAVREQDIFLNYPYHDFRDLISFLRTAAIDPQVKSIQMSLYRAANDSLVVNNLINAVRNNKEVTVVVELTARFDEQANIEWAHHLTEEGVNVVFSTPGLKVHSKLILIKRMENNRLRYYSHIGTGNFNEKTAKFYTDFSLFTYDQSIGAEIEHVFEFIKFPYKRFDFKHLWVSPVNCRTKFSEQVENEIKNAEAGLPAEIIVKCNNLVDSDIVTQLYQASLKGVKVKAIVRGMSTLSLPTPKANENPNFEIISIVGRYLEHTRVYVFANNGNPTYFMGSTDLMQRNLDYRVEVVVPIYDLDSQKTIQGILDLQWADNIDARVIDKRQVNKYRETATKRATKSQDEIFRLLQQRETALAEKLQQKVAEE